MHKNSDSQMSLFQMNPYGEWSSEDSLIQSTDSVRYQVTGKVNPLWLSANEKERSSTENLLEQVVSVDNLQRAYRRVKQNGGGAGVDGMQVSELGSWLGKHMDSLRASLLSGRYHPQAVRQVSIPKTSGGKRHLGIPSVLDRLIQQAISQILSVRYERVFHESSYGFRPSRRPPPSLSSRKPTSMFRQELRGGFGYGQLL